VKVNRRLAVPKRLEVHAAGLDQLSKAGGGRRREPRSMSGPAVGLEKRRERFGIGRGHGLHFCAPGLPPARRRREQFPFAQRRSGPAARRSKNADPCAAAPGVADDGDTVTRVSSNVPGGDYGGTADPCTGAPPGSASPWQGKRPCAVRQSLPDRARTRNQSKSPACSAALPSSCRSFVKDRRPLRPEFDPIPFRTTCAPVEDREAAVIGGVFPMASRSMGRTITC